MGLSASCLFCFELRVLCDTDLDIFVFDGFNCYLLRDALRPLDGSPEFFWVG